MVGRGTGSGEEDGAGEEALEGDEGGPNIPGHKTTYLAWTVVKKRGEYVPLKPSESSSESSSESGTESG